MKKAGGIVTNRGGRTCHAAIIARELGIPAIIGCGDATEKLAPGDECAVPCAEGDTGHDSERDSPAEGGPPPHQRLAPQRQAHEKQRAAGEKRHPRVMIPVSALAVRDGGDAERVVGAGDFGAQHGVDARI